MNEWGMGNNGSGEFGVEDSHCNVFRVSEVPWETGGLRAEYNTKMKYRLILIVASIVLAAAGCALSAEGKAAATPESSRATTPNELNGPPTNPGVAAEKEQAASEGEPNLKAPTLGGRRYWTDELVYHDWRIQRHADEGHYRLIDGDEVRHAWGTFEECRAKFEAIQREQKLPPLEGRVVLVLHGLGRTRISNEDMVEYLRANSKFTVLSVGYASTQADLATHARSLARVIEHLGPKVEEINFVAHSLGNIVIRHYLADQTDAANGRRPDPRIKRIVMVGAPNNGARLAQIFGQNSFYDRILGQSGRAIARQWNDLHKHLATPQTEFGIIAGGERNESGYNPLLPGDDDFIVSVDETKLPGARDFIVVNGLHALLMNNPEVQQAALRFVEHGYFVSEEGRQPLPTVSAAAK
jgi:pimeloyl-ACP methyl ester carboxylesterase